MTLRETLAKEISLEEIYQTMDFLVDEVGERLSGTPEMKKATEYIRDRLQGYGIDAWIDHFQIPRKRKGVEFFFVHFGKRIPICFYYETAQANGQPNGNDGVFPLWKISVRKTLHNDGFAIDVTPLEIPHGQT